jgi:hypothetical protein
MTTKKGKKIWTESIRVNMPNMQFSCYTKITSSKKKIEWGPNLTYEKN